MAELAKKKFLDLAGLSTFWEKAKAYVDAQSSNLTGVINGLTYGYESADKKIYLKNGETVIGSVDCTDFIKDSFVKSGTVVEVDGKQVLRLVLHTVERPGTTPTTENVDIDVNKLFSQNAVDIKMADGKTVEKALSDVIAESAQNKADIATITSKADDYKTADVALENKITTAYGAADTAIYNSIEAIAVEDINALFN